MNKFDMLVESVLGKHDFVIVNNSEYKDVRGKVVEPENDEGEVIVWVYDRAKSSPMPMSVQVRAEDLTLNKKPFDLSSAYKGKVEEARKLYKLLKIKDARATKLKHTTGLRIVRFGTEIDLMPRPLYKDAGDEGYWHHENWVGDEPIDWRWDISYETRKFAVDTSIKNDELKDFLKQAFGFEDGPWSPANMAR